MTGPAIPFISRPSCRIAPAFPESGKAMTMAVPKVLMDGPKGADWTITLAHGAGAPMDTSFMEAFALGLAARGYRVARFEFPYMAERRQYGTKRPPDREPVLRESWLKVVAKLGGSRLVIGGKSMGGRIASLIADEAAVAGLVCVGYPFHPTGKSDQLRIAHLQHIKTPTLIVQGERDPFGSREEASAYKLASTVRIVWMKDGDHSLKPRKKSGVTEEANWRAAVEEIDRFVSTLRRA
jgi:uncharacterized protein